METLQANVDKTFFLLNLSCYLLLDNYSSVFIYVQTSMALLSLLVVVINSFKRRVHGHIFAIIATCICIILYKLYNLHRPFTLVPLIYLLGIPTVRKILLKLKDVIGQSLWLIISLLMCHYVFATLGVLMFSKNHVFFTNQIVASLAFLELTTLDGVGSFAQESYKDKGFLSTFLILVPFLIVVHSLLNINMGFIVAYISDSHHGHRYLLDTNRNLIGEKVPMKIRILRIANVVASTSILIVPFVRKLNVFYLVATLISFLLICLEYHITKDVPDLEVKISCRKLIINSVMQILIFVYFFEHSHKGLYLISVLRLLLIHELTEIFRKVWVAYRYTSTILSLTLACFICFSIYVYLVHKRTADLITLFRSFIEAIQFASLDDITRILRANTWYYSMLGISFIVLLNHFLLNVIFAQVINALEEADTNRKKQDTVYEKMQREQNRIAQISESRIPSMWQNSVEFNEQEQIKKFTSLVKQLNYKCKR